MIKTTTLHFVMPPGAEDLLITHLKGSGPGGQNRNKRMTAVRVEHIPTGIVVVASERRSQKQNLDAALDRLNRKLSQLLHKPKTRVKTQATFPSRQKRLSEKKSQSQKKKLRGNYRDQGD